MSVGPGVSAHTRVEVLQNIKKEKDVHEEAQGVCCTMPACLRVRHERGVQLHHSETGRFHPSALCCLASGLPKRWSREWAERFGLPLLRCVFFAVSCPCCVFNKRRLVIVYYPRPRTSLPLPRFTSPCVSPIDDHVFFLSVFLWLCACVRLCVCVLMHGSFIPH